MTSRSPAPRPRGTAPEPIVILGKVVWCVLDDPLTAGMPARAAPVVLEEEVSLDDPKKAEKAVLAGPPALLGIGPFCSASCCGSP